VDRIFPTHWAGRTIVGLAALPAVAGLILLSVQALRLPASAGDEIPPEPPDAAARIVCSFSNDDAARATVAGADGGISVVLGDRTYWLFGDTLLLP
jgi:hypothetical protein